MPRDSELLVDSTLDRELEALLAVEPSPELGARVRSAVRQVIVTPWWQPRRAWLLAPVGLSAAALVAAIMLPTMTPTSPSELLASRSLQAVSSTQAPVVGGTSAPVLAPSTHVTRTSRPHPGRAVLSLATQPAILISAQEAQALRALLARAEPLHVRLVSAEGAATALPPGDIEALAVTPIVIKPLSESEALSEGARQ